MDTLSLAQSNMEESELAAIAAGSYKVTIAGIDLYPFTPARLLMLELVDSAFVRPKELTDIRFAEEIMQALYLLSCKRDDYEIVLRYVTRKRSFVDALRIVGKDDPKTGEMFRLYSEAETEYLMAVAKCAEAMSLGDYDAAHSEISSFIEKSTAAFQLMAKKKAKADLRQVGKPSMDSTSSFARLGQCISRSIFGKPR